jgi:hypothetical protein
VLVFCDNACRMASDFDDIGVGHGDSFTGLHRGSCLKMRSDLA